MSERYAVVGGGIAGTSVAYHLSQHSDADVRLYERGSLAGATTGKSAGVFALYGSPAEYRMKRYGLATYNEFLRAPHVPQRYDRLGHLEVATTPRGVSTLGSNLAEDPAHRPLCERLSGEELAERVVVPHLETGALESALHVPSAGAFDAGALAREFAARAEHAGATIHTGTTVTDLLVSEGDLTGLAVDGEFVQADHVVTAAGPWNGTIASMADVELPVGYTLAPILVLDPETDLTWTAPYVNHVESGVYLIGRRDGTILVGCHASERVDASMRPDEVPESVPDDLRAEMVTVASELVPSSDDAAVVDEWVGLRSTTPDGQPIAGPTERRGLSVVAFHSSGIQLAAAAGRVVATRLVGRDVPDYGDAVDPSRFSSGDDSRE